MKKTLLLLLLLAIPFASFAEKRLKALSYTQEYRAESGVFTYDSQGRITRVDIVNEKNNKTYYFTYTYYGSRIECYSSRDQRTTILELENGKVKTMTIDMPEEYLTVRNEFEYSGDKFIGMNQYTIENGKTELHERSEITWSGDNISEYNHVQAEGTNKEARKKMTFTHTNLSSTPLVNMLIDCSFSTSPDYGDFVYIIGFYNYVGTTPKNLIASLNDIDGEGRESNYTYNYETNANGDVVKINITRAKDNRTDVYTLEWEGSSSEPVNQDQEVEPSEEGNIDYGKDGTINADTELNCHVIGKIYYNIPAGAGGFNAVDGCLEITKSTNDTAMEGKDIFGEDFKDHFTGIVFKVPAGKGTVKVNAETTGMMMLKIRAGNNEPLEIMLTSKGYASLPYNFSEPTYIYIYGTVIGTSDRTRASSANSIKIYGVEWGNVDTGIKSVETANQQNDFYYNLNGQKVLNPQKGNIYIQNKKKILLKQ